MSSQICGVYAIVHRASGRAYVGSSRDVFRRWGAHAGDLSAGRHHATALQEAWRAEGPEAFVFVVLECCHLEDLPIREQVWLDSFESVLNSSKSARCPMFDPAVAARVSAAKKGMPLSAEHRASLSAALKGKSSPLAGRRFPDRIQVIGPEQRLKISKALIGHAISVEAREKMRRAKKHLSAEARENIAAAQRGRKNPAVAEANRQRRGMPLSERQRAHLTRLHESLRRRVQTI